VLYLRAAGDRLQREAHVAFEQAVEGARMGAVFASNLKAYRRWRAKFDSVAHRRAPLSDKALERAIMNIGQRFPGTVSRVQQGAGA